eukprot:756429-Hanusia_phi.AAC.1
MAEGEEDAHWGQGEPKETLQGKVQPRERNRARPQTRGRQGSRPAGRAKPRTIMGNENSMEREARLAGDRARKEAALQPSSCTSEALFSSPSLASPCTILASRSLPLLRQLPLSGPSITY